MNVAISSEDTSKEYLQGVLNETPNMEGLELSSKVSTKEKYYFGDESAKVKVGVLDLGIKKNILRCMSENDIYCVVYPWNTDLDVLLEENPDGIFISNGPGDPATMDYAVNLAKEVLNKDIPLFGICLGHQIIARACEINTYKMHIGHRGLNQPVLNLNSGTSEITSQNHGFSINKEEVEASNKVKASHVNLNDGTVEGIEVIGKKAFSVQYHPEAAPGPHDSRYLFKQFYNLITNN